MSVAPSFFQECLAMQKILIPIDGSERAMLAVHQALLWAAAGLKARYVVANVQPTANLYELVTAHDPAVLQQVNEAAGLDLLRPAAELLRAAGLEVEQDVATGDPAHCLLDMIETHGCKGVLLSARGHGGLHTAVLGSVSMELVRSAPVPVTVVKPPVESD
jgi:nucleotide-binding universal stress UspA family protein